MKFIFGLLFVSACVVGGYLGGGGHLAVLWQPLEFVIIIGGSIGAFIIATPVPIIKKTLASLKWLIAPPALISKKGFMELLLLQKTVFKQAKTNGLLTLERHIDNPHESDIFNAHPLFCHNHHAVELLSDALRLMLIGVKSPSQLEDMMNAEVDAMHHEAMKAPDAIQAMADGMPALGIVAAVLGVIHTMGSISEPPEILGHLIGAALVGTFAGVLISYGLFAPMASAVKAVVEMEDMYLKCLKSGILAFAKGSAPNIAVEFARKELGSLVRPTFQELEEAGNGS
ncbi:MAG: flagellar motor stator protein MotA [Alphaproteobacteria bacterium]